MNSIKLKKKVDTMFMNYGNSKTSDSYRPLINLLDKINLRRKDKRVSFIKSQHLLYMQKCKEVIQKQ